MKKMLPWLIIILVAITLITIAALVLWEYVFKEPLSSDPTQQAHDLVKNEAPKALTADEISKQTVKMEKITTNLADIQYIVQISFAFQMNNEDATKEFTTLEHLVKSAIIKTLSDTQPKDIQGSAGQDALISKLINSANDILKEGKVNQVDITDFIITKL